MSLLFIAAWVGAPTATVGVYVETATAGPACQALEAVAVALSSSADHRVARDPAAPSEVRVLRRGDDLSIAGPGGTERRPLAPEPLAAAEALLDTALGWSPPGDLDLTAWVTPSPEAWAGLCAAEAGPLPEAWTAGATGPFVERLLAWSRASPPPSRRRGPTTALAELAQARSGAARVRALRRLEADLDDRTLPPVWVRALPSGAPPEEPGPAARFARTGVAERARLAVVFERGRFLAVDLRDGSLEWIVDVGVAEPQLWAANGLLVAATDAGITALSPRGRVVWRAESPDGFGELAVDARRVFAASPRNLEARDVSDGSLLWSTDLDEEAVGGPVVAGDHLVLPTARHLEVRSLSDGRRLQRTPVPGGWSAPPMPVGGGRVFVFSGSDRAELFDLERGRFIRRYDDLPDLRWPPIPLHDALLFEVEERSRRSLFRVDRTGASRWLERASAPALALPAYLGVLVTRGRGVEAVAPDGTVRWRARLDEPPRVGATSEHHLALAGGESVFVLDGRNGDRAYTVTTPEPVVDVAWTERGGATIGERLYGLPEPGDPRIDELGVRVRVLHTEALLETGQRAAACRRLRDLARPTLREVEAASVCPR